MNAVTLPSSLPVRRQKQLLATDFAGLSARARGLYRGASLALAVAALLGVVSLFFRPQHLLPYLSSTLPVLLGVGLWTFSPRKGLPLFPLFLVQQGLIYSVPLVVENETLAYLTPGTVDSAGWAIGGFLLVCIGGWYLGQSLVSSQPSRGNLVLGEGRKAGDRCLSLAFVLLALSVAYEIGTRTGLIFMLLPGQLEGLFPIIRVFATAASLLGALLGGLIIGTRSRNARAAVYWGLLALIFVLSVADVLISAASGLVIAAAIGLALGKRRIPWVFLLVAFGIVGFLNQGKFVMRERYWSDTANSTSISMSRLPSFYVEWAKASTEFLFSGGREVVQPVAVADEGQSILDRIDNFQNMTYVIEAMEGRNIRPLGGETYSLIPPLLVPRFLWSEKPRTHEGQILLNLHFGRQETVEQTEKTYIAWGLLPEAVGNFGLLFGPLLLGGVLGTTMGWLEKVSMHKRLFSVEGMVLSGLLLIVAGSYEMVASVFITATFQFLVAVTIAGLLMLAWFGTAGSSGTASGGASKVRRRQRRPVSEVNE